MKRVLFTGGNGFIGAHLVDALLVAGYGVRALDLFGRRSDVPAIVLDMLRAAACLRWTPRVELTEGVARTWQWILGLGELDS